MTLDEGAEPTGTPDIRIESPDVGTVLIEFLPSTPDRIKARFLRETARALDHIADEMYDKP